MEKIKAIKKCECGEEIIIFRFRGSRDKCKKCLNKIRVNKWKIIPSKV